MTKREFASMALKLLGVYAIIEALPLQQYAGIFVTIVDDIGETEWNSFVANMAAGAIPFFTMGAMAVILITKSDKLAARLYPHDTNLDLRSGLTAEEIQAIGFSCVGVLVLLLAAPRIVNVLSSIPYLISDHPDDINRQGVLRNFKWNLLGVLVQAGLGILLVLRARGLSNILKRLQVGRYERIADAEKCVADEP